MLIHNIYGAVKFTKLNPVSLYDGLRHSEKVCASLGVVAFFLSYFEFKGRILRTWVSVKG